MSRSIVDSQTRATAGTTMKMLARTKDFLLSLYKDFQEQSPLKKVGIVFTVVTVMAGAIGWVITHFASSQPKTQVEIGSPPGPTPSHTPGPSNVAQSPAPVTAPKPAPSISALTPKQKEVKLAAWRKLNRQMEDFSAILKRGDQMLDTWLADTQADPSREVSKVQQFANDVYNMRLALEADHNTMMGDQAEVGSLVKEAVRPPGAEGFPGSIFYQLTRAAEALANDMASSQKYDRQNLEDRITATAQALRDAIDTLKNRQQEWNATAQAQIKTLSK